MSCSNPSEYHKFLKDFNNDLQLLNQPTLDFSDTHIIEKNMSYDAMCDSIQKKYKGLTIIYVSKKLNTYPDYAQRLIIYHEIGHCFYGLNHIDGNHIMNKNISSYANNLFYKENRLFYVNQLTTY